MKVITLFENRTISKEYKNKHGLSLYIETEKHKILFDTGTDDTFAKNAVKLGVNLGDVDIAVISHGHYDHGGGLETFLKLNSKAMIYIGRDAFEDHITKVFGFIKLNIGLKKELKNNSRFIFVDEIVRIDDELTLFGNVEGDSLVPKGNDKLLKRCGNGEINKDDFKHEINLMICENNKYHLFCGCSHRGIVNIVKRSKDITGCDVETVVGGFHLIGMDTKNANTMSFLDELSITLSNNNVNLYYTCHCTGEQAYNYLNKSMKNLSEIKTGMTIEI